MSATTAMRRWLAAEADPDYEPAKLEDIQRRLLTEDDHWLRIIDPSWRLISEINPLWRHPVARPRGRHRPPEERRCRHRRPGQSSGVRIIDWFLLR